MSDLFSDDFIVHWKKQFTKEQLWDSRQRLPFNVTASAVEEELAAIERETNGLLRYSFTEGLTQTRFVLATQGGAKGIDITIKEGVSGVAGWAYYSQVTSQLLDAWFKVGKTVKRLLDCQLDKCAAEQLVYEQGLDAFEDTELAVSFAGESLEGILSVMGWNTGKFRQAVHDLVNVYNVTTAPRPPKPGRKRPGRRADHTARHSQGPSMTLGTLMAVWPDVPSDRLEDRLVIWELWDKQRMMLKQIVSQVNPTESTIKRHLDALEEAGLLKRKRKKMNSR